MEEVRDRKVSVDSSVVDLTQTQIMPICLHLDTKVCEYPLVTCGAIVINENDLKSVTNQEGWLTDQAVDFWLMYMYETVLDKSRMNTVLVLTTDFFLFLTGAYVENMREMGKWMKDFDIFKSKMLVIPIVSSFHYFAIVVLDLASREPTIVIVDSLDNWEEQEMAA